MRRVLILLVALLMPDWVQAAQPIVDSSASAGNDSAASLTFSMTVSGSDRYLACGVSTQVTTRTVTSITFNGVALTKLLDKDNADDAPRQSRAEYWYLLSPSATTANVVVTLNGVTSVSAACVSFTQVNQATPHGTPIAEKGDGESTEVNVTSATDELVLDVTSMRVGTTPLIVGTGQTSIVNKVSGVGAGNVTLGMSTEPGAPSVAMEWSIASGSGNKAWTAIGVSLKGAAAATPGATITVCTANCDFPNSQLQSAMDAASDGTVILLESQHHYPGPSTGWIMGDKCAAPVWHCITIRTGVTAAGAVMSTSLFPPAGVRVTASDAVLFAKMMPTTNNEAALRTVYPGETGASCDAQPCLGSGWTVQWIEFTPKLNYAQRALVRFGTAKAGKEFNGVGWSDTLPNGETQDTLAEVPQYLSLIQCYIHGDAFVGQHQGLYLSSKDARIEDNVIDDIKSMAETQAITGINGLGPYVIDNNQLSATGENIIFGGADTYLRLRATVTGTPSTTSVELTNPLWVHLDGTTEAANFATDIYSGIFIALTHGGVDYGGIVCTFSGSTCTFPALAFTPSVGDTVRWTWQTGGITFTNNWFLKKLEWFSPILSPLTDVAVVAGTGGSLSAGNRCYKVQSHAFVSAADPTVYSAPVEVCALVGSGGTASVSWTADPHAQSYRIYGGASGAENQYWTVTAPTTTFLDTGTAGTAGTPPSTGSIFPVKNNFELKHGDGASPMGQILIEGNVMDYAWCCSQNNIISIKVNNQDKNDVSATIRNLIFRNNWIRHGNRALALTCTTTGNTSPQSPSGQMTDVTIANNLWSDMSSAWVNTSGTVNNSAVIVSTGNYANEVGSRGCVRITMTHNTFLYDTNDMNGPLWFNLTASTDKMTDFVLRDNIMARDCVTASCISNGNRAIKTFAPNNLGNNAPVTAWNGATTGSSFADHNAWPDGSASLYTAGPFTTPFFPTDADLKASHLTDYASCKAATSIMGCALLNTSNMHNAGSDGADIGANVSTIKAFTDAALNGGPIVTTPVGPSRPRLRIRIH